MKSESIIEITKAICKVIKEIKNVEKNTQVGGGSYGYKGVSDKDVKVLMNDLLPKHGLCIVPTDINAKTRVDRWQDGAKQKQQIFVEMNTKYMLMHESGEFIEISGYGHGVDPQDKAAGQATTYAMKYTLLYTFLIPTGEIDDSDKKHSNDTAPPPQIQKPAETKKEHPTKPWLNKFAKDKPTEVMPFYTKVILGAREKNLTLVDLQNHYSISKPVQIEINNDLK